MLYWVFRSLVDKPTLLGICRFIVKHHPGNGEAKQTRQVHRDSHTVFCQRRRLLPARRNPWKRLSSR